MAAALGHADVAIIVNGEEDVCDLVEIGQSAADVSHIGLLHEEESHAWPQQNDARLGVSRQGLALEVFFPKGDVVVGQPIVLEGFDIFDSEKYIVIRQV